MVEGPRADAQFRVAPHAFRDATFGVIRYNSGPRPQGRSFALDTVLCELRVLPNGQQVETVRDYAVHLPGLAPGASANASAEKVQGVKEAIQNLFKRE